MSALETVKELGRMATTATLTKDVIDLFSKKVDLLEKQVAALEQENSSLKGENSNLKSKIGELEQQLESSRPKAEPFSTKVSLARSLPLVTTSPATTAAVS